MVVFSKMNKTLKIGASISVIIILLKLLKTITNKSKKRSKKNDKYRNLKKVLVDKTFVKNIFKILKMTVFKKDICLLN